MNFFLFFLIVSTTGDTRVLSDTIIINDWQYLGPFSIGVREGITGLDLNFSDEKFQPDTTESYYSFLAQGGIIKWRKIKTENEYVDIEYSSVLWDTIQDYYGISGLSSVSIVYGEFESGDIITGLVSAQGLGSFVLNGRVYPGDVYRDDYVQIPVILNKGKNKVILRPSGYGTQSFSFKIITNPPPLMIVRDITIPDFIQGESYSGYIGIPVMNTTDKQMCNFKIEIYGDEIQKIEKEILRIIPLSAMKIPLPLKSKPIRNGDSTLVRIHIYNKIYDAKDSVWIKIKKLSVPYMKTFISNIDNSCQYYAVLPPKNWNPESTYALIMSCHGANVEARNLIKYFMQKEWAYVIAPTNRRRYGFDWQDWGRLDFLEVLEDVKKNFNIDEDRVYLTGHSMGGHGVWHIGLSHPDLFAALAPSAGWTSFQLYFPWFLQRSEIFAEPEQIKFRDMVLREDNTPVFLENALNLPVYILHGGADDNVPPIQGRMSAQYLKELGYDFIYHEIEGKGHWWDTDSTPEIDCVDLQEMIEFLKEKKRNFYPESIVFKTSDIGHSNKAYWIRIDELENIYQDGKITARASLVKLKSDIADIDEISLNVIEINTENISGFTIEVSENLFVPIVSSKFKFQKPHKCYNFAFIINGQEIRYLCEDLTDISFIKCDGEFRIIKHKQNKLIKTAELYGPIKQAYFSPFILVYGTIGDSVDTENNLHQARLQSYSWWIRANGFCEIIPDTEITEEHIKNFNLILFGNAQTNKIIRKINKKLPINFTNDYEANKHMINKIGLNEDCIAINNKVLRNPDLCLMEIYPNPMNPKKFVLLYSATTKKAQRYLGLFPVIYSGSGLPDFIIWDTSTTRYGWAGIIAAGFFDKNWKIDNKLIYVRDNKK